MTKFRTARNQQESVAPADRYKWVALANTTASMFMATLDGSTAGMAVFGGSFIGLMLLPVNFPYPAFALLIALNGIGSGMFAAPNSSSIMGSVPASQRGAASGMRSTFQNSGTALSIGVLLGHDRRAGQPPPGGAGQRPGQHGVAPGVAHQIAALPPVSSLFGAVLGVNPLGHLLDARGGLAASQPRPGGPSPAGSSSPASSPARSSTAWSSCSPWPPSCPSWPPWHRPCGRPPRSRSSRSRSRTCRSRTSSAASRVSSGRTFQTGLVQAELA